jgi:hypothetical protein
MDSNGWAGAQGRAHSGSGNDSGCLADEHSHGHHTPSKAGQGGGGSSGGGVAPLANDAATAAAAAAPAALASGPDQQQPEQGAAAGSGAASTAAAAAVAAAAAGQAADGGTPASPGTPATPLPHNPFSSVSARAWSVSVADDEAGEYHHESAEPASGRLLTVAAAATQVAPTLHQNPATPSARTPAAVPVPQGPTLQPVCESNS